MVLNAENYLRRISFHDEIQIDQSTLAKLHRQHIKSVPFENLDIHHGRKIRLDLKVIEDKIVSHHRGGFCYELNGLFGALLRQLGFDVKMISARVYERGKIGREFDHMVLRVNLGEEWLIDVGFGDSFLEPLRIAVGMTQQDPAGYFRIERHDSTYLRLDSSKDDLVYSPKYLFTLDERGLEDFVEMCEYHQTSAESSFTWEELCTVATENGRITLRGQNLIETLDGHKTVRQITDDQEYEQILRDRFRIEIR
jgi:N-hydroxyarylamine O-acetyltransferase